MYVVSVGNPFDGVTLVGPFATWDEAEQFTVNECSTCEWHIVKVEKP